MNFVRAGAWTLQLGMKFQRQLLLCGLIVVVEWGGK